MYWNCSFDYGQPIARLRVLTDPEDPNCNESDSEDEDNGRIIRIYKSNRKQQPRFFKFDDPAYRLTPIYHTQQGGWPNRMIFAGASLCGKSYLAGKIAETWKEREENAKRRINIFSHVKHDPAYDDIPGIRRIRCDEELLEDPIDIEDMHDSLCIFDDINSFPDKKIGKELNDIRDKCLKSGRHHNIAVISADQVLMDGRATRERLLNGFQIIVFPRSGGRYQAKNFLERYLSLDKHKIDNLLSLPSRWIIINRTEPLYYLHEQGFGFIE